MFNELRKESKKSLRHKDDRTVHLVPLEKFQICMLSLWFTLKNWIYSQNKSLVIQLHSCKSLPATKHLLELFNFKVSLKYKESKIKDNMFRFFCSCNVQLSEIQKNKSLNTVLYRLNHRHYDFQSIYQFFNLILYMLYKIHITYSWDPTASKWHYSKIPYNLLEIWHTSYIEAISQS